LPDRRFQIPDFPIVDSRLSITDARLAISDCHIPDVVARRQYRTTAPNQMPLYFMSPKSFLIVTVVDMFRHPACTPAKLVMLYVA
jgi:hypothetical protein